MLEHTPGVGAGAPCRCAHDQSRPNGTAAPGTAFRVGRAGKTPPTRPYATNDLPPTPPDEVLQALDRAAEVAEQLRTRGLRLTIDASAEQDVRIDVVDHAGSVVRRVPVVPALELLSGERPLAAILDR